MRILIDESLPHGLKGLAIVVLVAPSNRLEAYKPIAGKLRKAIETARPGAITKVAA